MLNPIQTAQKAKGFSSFGATAKALISQFPDKDWGLKPRSLETQIGKLDRGEATWWRNHPDAAQALAVLLDLSLDDLGLHKDAGASHLFRFTEFPGLKPLDLKREKPWQIGSAESDEKRRDSKFGKPTLEAWLDPVPTAWGAPHGMHWLSVTDALERQLLTRYLAAISRYEVVVTNCLADASAPLQNKDPLILVVQNDVSGEDLKSLGIRHGGSGLLVIASNPMPKRQEISSMEYMSWERFNLRGEERSLFDLTTSGTMGDIKHWTWKLQPDWRSAVLQWVEKRLNKYEADTLFDAQSLGHWLERFDPLDQWFETTADLLHLCEIAHLKSEKKLPKPHDLDAGSKLTQLLFSDKSSPRGEQIKQLAQARWNCLDVAGSGALPMSVWLSLLPANQLPPSAEDVRAIAAAKTAAERKKAAEHVISQLHEGNPTALRTSGLLKESAGQFDFEHRTLVRLIVRDQLMRQITDEPASSWALACFDADRRLLVDAALDAVSLTTLVRSTERLLLSVVETENSAEALGASEALFIAIGRRIANREVIDEKFLPVLTQLAERVVSKLDFTLAEYSWPEPWSRPIQLSEQQLAWLSACWAWSLLQEAAPKERPTNWLFPGWCDEPLPEPPHWLSDLWPEEDCEQLSASWQYFFKVADEWVKNWDQPIDNPPRLLKMALLGCAAHGAWAADSAWWKDLIGHKNEWTTEAVMAQLKAADQSAAVRLWPSYLAFEKSFDGGAPSGVLLSPVRFWLLRQLSPAEGLADLTFDDLNYLSSCPESLPPAFRAPLLRARCQRIRFKSFGDTAPFIARFGPSVLPVLPELLTHDWLGSAAAEWLWAWDDAEAERLLCDDTVDRMARHHLLDACPANKVAMAAALLLEKTTFFSVLDYVSWAKGHLPTACKHAEVLVKIINSSAANP